MITNKIFLSLLLLVSIVIGFNNQMFFLLPLTIVVYLNKERLTRFAQKFSYQKAFLLYGLLFGLLTEFFAILDNLDLPREKRILLHPDPSVDLVFGFFYYGLFTLTWMFLLKRYDFSKKAIFIASGIFGIFSEQGGAIFLGVIANPILGTLLAFLVMSVYGIFPSLAYYLTRDMFPERPKPRFLNYAFLPVALFLFWAIYGNVFHKLLLLAFG